MKRIHLFLMVALLWPAAEARAVIVSTNDPAAYTTGAPVPNYASVLRHAGYATALYLGNDWALTADHVGAGTLQLDDGHFVQAVSGSSVRLNAVSGGGQTDIVLFRLDPTDSEVAALKPLTIASATPTINTPVILAGYGLMQVATTTNSNGVTTANRVYYHTSVSTDSQGKTTTTWTAVTDPTTQAYDKSGYSLTSSPSTKYYGYNTTVSQSNSGTPAQATQDINIGYGNLRVAGTVFSDTEGNAQGIGGDSGGAVFDATTGEVVGMIDATGTYNGQPGNAIIFGDTTVFADLASYRDQIEAIITPEPSSLMLAAAPLLLLCRRRATRQ